LIFALSQVATLGPRAATPSCHDYLLTIRNELISEGIFKQKEHAYTFQESYIFFSPSTAAAVVLGRNTNGWVGWKNNRGQTLDELERK
jgi:hypothetical protein